MSQPHRLTRNRTRRDGTGAYETADGVITVVSHAARVFTLADGKQIRRATMVPQSRALDVDPERMEFRRSVHFGGADVVGQAQHPQQSLVQAYGAPLPSWMTFLDDKRPGGAR